MYLNQLWQQIKSLFKGMPLTVTPKNSGDDKKQMLFENQKQMLDTFLSHGAITKEQYNKSLNGLIEKMNIKL